MMHVKIGASFRKIDKGALQEVIIQTKIRDLIDDSRKVMKEFTTKLEKLEEELLDLFCENFGLEKAMANISVEHRVITKHRGLGCQSFRFTTRVATLLSIRHQLCWRMEQKRRMNCTQNSCLKIEVVCWNKTPGQAAKVSSHESQSHCINIISWS
ncbi:hypothetical protein V6N11_084240 [Hibiscus sabdariffa]|uniref:Uncharacterized protein n=1 Tax=Hibiscus sabdariffa TaxID=183260 RepID=A0ABR2QSF4_9ROSI